jgi:hypothetical protein
MSAELLHVHVQHRAGPVVFVPPDRLAGGAVDVPQPVEAASGQGVHG